MSDDRIVAKAQSADPVLAEGEPAVVTMDLSGYLRVKPGGGGSISILPFVDLTTDAIAAPASASSLAGYSLAFNETDAEYKRLRALELTEGAGFPAYNLTTAGLPYLLDELQPPTGDFFIARGRLGVQFVRDPGPRGITPSQFAIDQVAGGATPFRRALAAAAVICDVFEALNNSTASADFAWWQLWDLPTEADVPTAASAVLPVKVLPGAPRAAGEFPLPQVWPPGGYQLRRGLVISCSSTPLWWTAPPAGLAATEAITNVAFHLPELPL